MKRLCLLLLVLSSLSSVLGQDSVPVQDSFYHGDVFEGILGRLRDWPMEDGTWKNQFGDATLYGTLVCVAWGLETGDQDLLVKGLQCAEVTKGLIEKKKFRYYWNMIRLNYQQRLSPFDWKIQN